MTLEAWFVLPALALMTGVLALAPLGVHVLRRGVVFMDLAVAQAAAAAALAVTALADHPSWIVTQLCAAGGAVLAAAVVAGLAWRWPAQREALIGLVYVACASGALLVARQDVHGAEHLHALLAADVLWSNWAQVGQLAACAAAVALVRTRLERDLWFFTTFALVVSLAVQALGLFAVFAALIAPALWHRAGYGLAGAVALALISTFAGLAASWILDAPSGPLVALAMALVGVASGFARRSGLG